jgi:hypothetical protein
MRALARTSIAAATLLTAGAGCFLLTGSTDGYTLAPPEAGICTIDASSLTSLGVTLSCGCTSSADCHAGARFCCFGVSLTGTSASGASSCQATACDAAVGAQLCEQSSECVDAACIGQTCTFSELSIPVRACGHVNGCTP